MPTPDWLAATTGQPGLAGQVNQFLGTHAVQALYQGALQASEEVTSGSSVLSDTAWYAQSFTAAAGQTAVGYVMVYIVLNGSPSPWPVSLCADNGSGAPLSATPLVTAELPKEFAPSGFAWVPVPLPATGLTPGARYWIVAQQTGDSGDNYAWAETTQTSGASSSGDGVTWASHAYGLTYQAWDQAAVPPLAGTWEDSGARWTWLTWSGGELTEIWEYTAGQAAGAYAASARALAYSGYLPSGAA